MTIVNASDWPSVHTEGVSHYHVGPRLSSPTRCAECFRPFAWLEFDHQSGAISAGRDHFGQEPLYYYKDRRVFVFGSNLPDVLRHLPVHPDLSDTCRRELFARFPHDEDPPYSTETYYDGVHRLTPGHILRIDGRGNTETPYWTLDPQVAPLEYARDEDYLDHFSALLDEALDRLLPEDTRIAAEFSGGLDSSAIFVACRKAGLSPVLLTQPPPAGYRVSDEDFNVRHLLESFQWHDKHLFVDASDFDPIAVFRRCAQVFAGSPPYWESMLATPVYERAASLGCQTLISGFAGDDCVSLNCPPYLSYFQHRRERGMLSLLRECVGDIARKPPGLARVRLILRLLQYIDPRAFSVLTRLSEWCGRHDPQAHFYRTLRDYEYAVLQGDLCHDLRMKVEHNAVLGRSFGLVFVYPLLYPPLIEFCFRLPFHKQKHRSVMRCLIREYIAAHVKGVRPDTKGGAFVPSAMQKCREYEAQGRFRESFTDLPYRTELDALAPSDFKMMQEVRAFMIKSYLSMRTDAAQA